MTVPNFCMRLTEEPYFCLPFELTPPNMIQKFLLALCICASLFCATNARLIILSPDDFAADYETAQIFFRDTLEFEPINGTMVLVPRGSEEEVDVQGKIALISIRLPHEQAVRNLQNRGAIAVVMGGFTGVPGFVMYTGDNGDTSDILIPMVELADENWQLLVPNLNSSVDLRVIVTSEEGNAWRDVLASPWMYVIQISIGLLAISCIIVASIQLHRFVKSDGGKLMFHIPQVCLLLNILSNLDPQGTRQVYDRLGNTIMVMLHVPLTLIPCLLVTFYWHEILNRQSIIINRGIKKARIPFIILSVFIFAFEITFSTLRGLDLGLQNLMLIIMVIIYIVVSVGISIFYFITSIRVLLRMRTSTRTRHVHMKRTTKRIVVTSACLVLFCISLIMLAPLAQFPVGFAFDLWFVIFSCASLSMSNILSFTPPPKSISSVSSGKTQKKSASENPGMTMDTLPTDTTAESKA